MAELEFTNLLIVAAIGFTAPLLLGLAPAIRIPAVVLEIVAGILVGPSVLGWVEVDDPVEVVALIGLAFVLFIAGLEIDPDRLKGKALGTAGLSYAVSFGIAVLVGLGLSALDLADGVLIVAIILSATSLGIVVPVLKDTGNLQTPFGQLVTAAATVADFAAVILLALFFGESGSIGDQAILLGIFVGALVLTGLAIFEVAHSRLLTNVFVRLQDTTAQIRVRGAFMFVVGLAALASGLGLELILGAFAAGVILTLLDRDGDMTHPQFRHKLEAIGFGVFIPVFFVTSGVRFDLDALTESASTLAMIPIFLVALLLVRGLPVLLYRRAFPSRQLAVAGLLQATSLPFIIAATAIGVELGELDPGTAAAMIAAGLLSVVIFPALALVLLGNADGAPDQAPRPVRRPVAARG